MTFLRPTPPPRSWFTVSWSRTVDPNALAGWFDHLAGVHGRGAVVLEARATRDGIEHLLGIPASRAQLVVGSTQAALPGVRLDPLDAPAPLPQLRTWQVRFTTHRR